MKRLTKSSIDELRKQIPVLSETENRKIIAGSGNTFGDPLYTWDQYSQMFLGFLGNG